MRLIGRLLLLLPLGLLLAIPFGFVALLIGVAVEPAAQDLLGALGVTSVGAIVEDLAQGEPPDAAAVALLVALWTGFVALLVVPPALVALIGEVFGWRAFAWYGGGTGALTAALPWLARGRSALARATEQASQAEGRLTLLLFLAGTVSGLIYWLVAGRSAGPSPASGEVSARSPSGS